jgi:hypothetical protein
MARFVHCRRLAVGRSSVLYVKLLFVVLKCLGSAVAKRAKLGQKCANQCAALLAP